MAELNDNLSNNNGQYNNNDGNSLSNGESTGTADNFPISRDDDEDEIDQINEIEDMESAIEVLNLGYNDIPHYKRRAFHSCINVPVDESHSVKQTLITELKKLHNSKLGKIASYHQKAIERYEDKIRKEKEYLADEEDQWQISINDLEEKLKVEEQKLSEIQKEITDKYKSYGEERKKLISNSIEEVKKALNDLSENHKELTKGRKQLLSEFDEKKKESNAHQVQYLRKLLDSTQDRHNAVIDKIKSLNIQGISPYVFNFLIYVGIVGTVVSGWFFSIYAKEKNLETDNILFFILKGISKYAELLNTNGYSSIVAILIFLGFIIFMGLFIRYTETRQDRRNNANISLSFGSRDSSYASIRADSLRSFWQQILPAVFFLGLIVLAILVAYEGAGEIEDDLTSLDIYLSAQIMGTALAFALSGVIYLYFIKVVEKRIEQNDENANIILMNIELFVVVIGFLIIILINIFFSSIKKIDFSLAIFLITCLITSLCLAYGYRYHGLIKTENYLLQKINRYSAKLAHILKHPDNDDIITKENKHFNKHYLELTDQLYRLIKAKNDLTIKVFDGKTDSKKPPKKKEKNDNKNTSFIQIIGVRAKQMFSRVIIRKENKLDENGENEEDKIRIKELELFPEFDTAIEVLQDRENSKKITIISLKGKITKRKDRERLRQISNRIDNLKRVSEKRQHQISHESNQLDNYYDKIVLAVDDGYNLALWHHKGKLGAIDFDNNTTK